MNNTINLIKEQYGIECVTITQQIGGWSALAYKLSDGFKNYFLKVYEKNRASTPKLTALIDTYIPITLWLNKNTELRGKLPVPILTKDGEAKCEDKYGIYLLYEYIDGETIGSKGLTIEQTVQLADIVATLHSYGKEVPVSTNAIREEYYLPFLCQMQKIFSESHFYIPYDVKALIGKYKQSVLKMIEKVRSLSKVLQFSKPKMVLCHTDIHPWNLIQTSQGLILIDWEGLKLAPPEADLALLSEEPYYEEFIRSYRKNIDIVIHTDIMQFYKMRRNLEDIWEFIEQLLYDKQENEERIKTLKYLEGELFSIDKNFL
ncbi:kinase [Tissierella sp. P1]|uniref:aminoglycoside phosphotransferase family protein n=1 Tax=Tissierella sp. P1 TaxID=1280483 RepID=UPI000BA15069|nr:aminoglycoside phosphotransferase family protein [Tissierella sp. P1]OZV13107.1 kinase [Tissierella sp. P1]